MVRIRSRRIVIITVRYTAAHADASIRTRRVSVNVSGRRALSATIAAAITHDALSAAARTRPSRPAAIPMQRNAYQQPGPSSTGHAISQAPAVPPLRQRDCHEGERLREQEQIATYGREVRLHRREEGRRDARDDGADLVDGNAGQRPADAVRA